MIEKIKNWLYLNHGLNIQTRSIWLILFLLLSILILVLLLINNANRGEIQTGKTPVPGEQIPGAPPGVRYVNPPVSR